MSTIFVTAATIIYAIGIIMSDNNITMISVPTILIGIFWLLHERLPRKGGK